MAIKVKAGTPEGVHSNIPRTDDDRDVTEFDESTPRSRPTDVTELRGRGKNGREMVGVLDERSPTQVDQDANRARRSRRRIDMSGNTKEDDIAWMERKARCDSRRTEGVGGSGYATCRGVKALNVESGSKAEVIDKRDTSCPNKISLGYNHGRAGLLRGDKHFVNPMVEALTGETNQGNPFDIPAVGSTKPRTLSEAMTELVLRFKLFVVAVWLPEDYEVVQKQPLVDVKEFIAEARALWDSYEPLLGGQNTTTILQVEAPPELEEEENNG